MYKYPLTVKYTFYNILFAYNSKYIVKFLRCDSPSIICRSNLIFGESKMHIYTTYRYSSYKFEIHKIEFKFIIRIALYRVYI